MALYPVSSEFVCDLPSSPTCLCDLLPIRTPSTLGGARKGLCALTNQSSCVAGPFADAAPAGGANGSDPKGSDPDPGVGLTLRGSDQKGSEPDPGVGLDEAVGPNAAAKGSLAELWN